MKRDEQIGRMILEASTGLHGDMARDIAQAWFDIAHKKQELQSRLEQAEKDAARYRWLRDECGIVEYKEAFGSVGAGMLPSGEVLDDAIDTAMQSAKESQ